MRLYSIYDRKMRQYLGTTVMLSVNDETMARELRSHVPPDHLHGKYAEDFDLMWIGAMSLETGVIATQVPVYVANLREILNPRPKVPAAEEVAGKLSGVDYSDDVGFIPSTR